MLIEPFTYNMQKRSPSSISVLYTVYIYKCRETNATINIITKIHDEK